MTILAVIPAKSHSRRLPNKNFRRFFGKPIIDWVIKEAVLATSVLFDKIVVSTDKTKFRNGLVDILIRPQSLCSDTATVDEVCLHALTFYPDYDYLCCIYPTAYAVTAEDLILSYHTMVVYDGNSCYSYGMVNGEYEADNGGFYWVKVNTFLQIKKLMNDRGVRYKMEQIDINTPKDLALARRHARIIGRFYE